MSQSPFGEGESHIIPSIGKGEAIENRPLKVNPSFLRRGSCIKGQSNPTAPSPTEGQLLLEGGGGGGAIGKFFVARSNFPSKAKKILMPRGHGNNLNSLPYIVRTLVTD